MMNLSSPSARPGRWAIAVGLLYVLLGCLYVWATPPLESSDEYTHYPVVQYMQTHGRLPVLDPAGAYDDMWQHQAAQPQFYYAVMAALTAGIDTSDLPELHRINHHFFVGNAAQIKNKNIILHQPDRESWPWTGTVLAVYLIRMASIGLGVGTLIMTYRLGRLLYPRDAAVAVTAVALTAFNPMFLFISAAVNNDSLAALLGVTGLYWLVQVWREPPDWRRDWWPYVRLGLLIGVSILTKLSFGGLLLLAGVVTAAAAWRDNRPGILFGGGVLILTVATAVSGWWFWRNVQLYGDLTGLNAFIEVMGRRETGMGWQDWRDEFGTFYRTYWGLFGGVNIAAPQWFYTVCNGLFAVGTAGYVWREWRQGGSVRSGRWLAAVWAAVLFLLLVQWTIIYFSFQGRLIFPALGGINVLWAAGLGALHTKFNRAGWTPTAVTVGFLLAMAAGLPITHIAPAYAYPQPTAVPDEAAFGPYTFTAVNGEQIALVGVEVAADQTVVPAGPTGVDVTLYWRAETPLSENYVTAVHLLGRDLDSVGQVDRYPGWGMWPPEKWTAGQVWRDPYRIWVRADAPVPARLQLSVSVLGEGAQDKLTAVDENGSELPLVIVGQARLAAPDNAPVPEPPTVINADFADFITLRGYGMADRVPAGGTLDVTLYWRGNGRPGTDYTVFVQLLNAAGQRVAGADAPPLNGGYPTGMWRAGDQIVEQRPIEIPADLPPGEYTVAVGLYDPQTGARVPLVDGGDAMRWSVTIITNDE